MTRVMQAWDAFWFSEVPAETYSVLRVAFGAVGLLSLVGLLPFETFWVPGGLMPLPGGGLGIKTWLIESGLAYPFAVALFALLLLGHLSLLVGYRSAVAVPVCLVGWVVQSVWNPLPLAGGNEVLGIVLFCLLWADTENRPGPAWPLRLIRIQIAFIYCNSAFWKLMGPTWRDGSTIHYVLNLNTFQRFPVPLPLWAEPLATFATYFTLFWEAAFPLLLLTRVTRGPAILAGVLLHFGLWIVLELGPFSWVMLASYLAFLEPGWAQAIGQRLPRLSLSGRR